MGALVMDRQGRAPTTDAQLAHAAISGDGDAFAQLYDRHERRAFNLCYRITGSREDAADATQDAFLKVLQRLPALGDRDLDFGNYLLTAARHASYDVMTRAGRAEPRDEIPDTASPVGAAAAPPPEEDPERRALLEAQQEEIRRANAELPVRQREALALYELGELSYDEIADELEMNRNSVAQLISRARVNLRDGLRRTALASILPGSPACERALPLIAMRDDRQLDARSDDASWLRDHLADCETCRLGAEAMAEAGASYRAWALVPAVEVLRRETIAKAAEMLGHDWTAAAGSPRTLGSTAGAAGGAAGAFAGAASAGATGAGGLGRRIGRDLLIAGGIGAIILGGFLSVRTADRHTPAGAPAASDAGLVGVDPALLDGLPAAGGKASSKHRAGHKTVKLTGTSSAGLLGNALADAAGAGGGSPSGTPKKVTRARTHTPVTSGPGSTTGSVDSGSPTGTGSAPGAPADSGTPGTPPDGNPQAPSGTDNPTRGGGTGTQTGDNGSSSSGSTPTGGDPTGGVTHGGTQTNTNDTSTSSTNTPGGTPGTGSPRGGDKPSVSGTQCAPNIRGCLG